MQELIYHLTTLDLWERAQDIGFYESKGFAEEGFIHCATENQLDGVLERYFARHENLIKLIIDPSRLTHKLQYDMSDSLLEEFPHIYGPLNIEAVVQIVFLDPISSEM